MSEVKTLVTLVLGGAFDHNELGDIDIVYEAPACEALQRELVTDSDDVHVELVSRIDYDAAQSQLAALREELASAVKDRETLLRLHVHLRARRSYWITEEGKAQQRLADAERRNAVRDIESAAKVLANCMDYPWEHMPENGRALMRKHAKDVIEAALNPKPEAASHE